MLWLLSLKLFGIFCPFSWELARWGLEQPGPGVPAHGRGLELDDLQGPLKPQPISDSMIELVPTCLPNAHHTRPLALMKSLTKEKYHEVVMKTKPQSNTDSYCPLWSNLSKPAPQEWASVSTTDIQHGNTCDLSTRLWPRFLSYLVHRVLHK